ncbi:MAG: hypothetical protein DHS20C18_43820 [Saprospiraceae bacterium]|nr:MAG: hypothetical protein DHS20C18_43820 [Saprospiraceae bacterium]
MGILSNWVYGAIGFQGWLPNLVALLLIFAQGLMINAIVFQFRMSNEINLFPGLFYILIGSLIPEFYHLTPLLMANTFYIMAIWGLFGTYKVPSCANRIFNIGLLMAISSLFYFSYILFILQAIVGLNILRAFQIRERLMVIVGAIIPYFYLGFYYFWHDELNYFLELQFSNNTGFLDFTLQTGLDLYIGLGLFIILFLVAILSYGEYTSKKQIQVQKKMNILFWGLLITGLSLLVQADIQLEHLLILNVPLGIFIAENFTLMSRRTAETIHWVIVFGILFMQYSPLA